MSASTIASERLEALHNQGSVADSRRETVRKVESATNERLVTVSGRVLCLPQGKAGVVLHFACDNRISTGPTPRVAKPGPRPKPKAPRLAAPAIPVGPARTAYVRRRLAAGDKLQPIADSLGISRERVRQIARDNGFRELTDPRRRRQTKPCPQCGGPMIVTASTRTKHCSRGCAQAGRRKEWAAVLERVCALRREGVGWVAVGKKFGMTRPQMLSAAFRWAAQLGVEIPLGPNYESRPGRQRLR